MYIIMPVIVLMLVVLAIIGGSGICMKMTTQSLMPLVGAIIYSILI